MDLLKFKGRIRESFKANILGRPFILLASIAGSIIVARVLGAEALAVLVAIRAFANSVTTFSDLGFSYSLIKILPDLTAKFGRKNSIAAVKRINMARLLIVPLVTIIMYWVLAPSIDVFSPQSGAYLLIISLCISLLSMIANSRKYTLIAALKNKHIVKVEFLVAVVGPFVSVAAAVIWVDAYIVAMSLILIQVINLGLLYRGKGYDLDTDENNADEIKLKDILHYWKYLSVNYIKYLFNRFIIRPPLLVFVLLMLSAPASDISNVNIALALVFQFWAITNMPLSQLRAAVINHFFANQDFDRLGKFHLLTISIIVLIAPLAAITVYSIGYSVFVFLYGDEFSSGCHWAAIAGTLALVGNIFSLGNSTLQQLEQYKAQIFAMCIALMVIITGVVYAFINDMDDMLFFVVLAVSGRLVFWVITDIYSDFKYFHWRGFSVKIKSLVSVMIILLGISMLQEVEFGVHAAMLLPIGVVGYLLLFRLVGGIGSESRNMIIKNIPGRYAGFVKLI
jgi:O-antigen/teichoic acid export membrane protein